MKKILLTMNAMLISLTALAFDIKVDRIYYNFLNEEEVEVTYKSYKIGDFKPNDFYTGDIIIPENITYSNKTYIVTKIGDHAFYICDRLISIKIPNSIKSIGEEAFAGCSGLTAVHINDLSAWCNISYPVSTDGSYHAPNPLHYAQHLFLNGEEITELKIPDGVNVVRAETFGGCSGLTSLEIPNSVTSIEEYAFFDCSGLTSLEIPNSVTSIGEGAFGGCSGLTSIEIPNSVTSIGEEAFGGCSGLTSLEIPNSVSSVGRGALSYCSRLKSVTLPDDITELSEGLLEGCSGLSSIEIPKFVTIIGESAFRDCFSLTSIEIPNSVTSIGECAFSGCSSLTSIEIPNSVIYIGREAFYECTGLSSIEIPNSVTSIGEGAFEGCSGLTIVTIPHSITTISANLFAVCTGLTSIEIPNSVTSIGEGAFQYCPNLTSIEIPNSVSSIGLLSFAHCIGLASIEIPNSVTFIGDYAFYDCTGLNKVAIYSNTVATQTSQTSNLVNIFGPQVTEYVFGEGIESIGDYACFDCLQLTSVSIPNNLKSIGDHAFSGCNSLVDLYLMVIDYSLENKYYNIAPNTHYLIDGEEKTDLVIPNTVTYLGNNAFRNSKSIKSVEIPTSTQHIGTSAFMGCTAVTIINLSSSKINTIEANVFNDCEGLSEILLPDIITEIKENAFNGCSSLKSISLPSNLKAIEANAFAGCKQIYNITIPENVETLGLGTFSDCSSLESITINSSKVIEQGEQMSNIFGNQVMNYFIGDKVTSIGDKVFADDNMKTITLGDNVTYIGSYAFGNNTVIKVNRGCKTLLSLWNSNYNKPVDIETSEVLPPTSLTFVSSTQTTASFSVDNIYPEYITTYDGVTLKSDQIKLTELWPELESSLNLKVSSENIEYNTSVDYSTESLNIKVQGTSNPTAFTVTGTYTEGDAEVLNQKMMFVNQEVKGNTMTIGGGLDPSTTYDVEYIVTVGCKNNTSKELEYKTQGTVTTTPLQFNTLPPKVVSTGEVIVAALSNIANDEEKVGFEWRRSDAPDEIKSKSGEAYLYEGTLEGIIHNLTSYNYWRYRPYYESSSGNRYYGDWGVVAADDESYFEPTVHTYAYIEVEGNSADVKGYAIRGTDEVEEQGFMYWESDEDADYEAAKSRRAPSNAKIVTATGQVMTATIKGLAYEQSYNYVAFVKTSKGETFYGEQMSFTTDKAADGIEDISSERSDDFLKNKRGIYTLQGVKVANDNSENLTLPCGLYIINGKKVLVK